VTSHVAYTPVTAVFSDVSFPDSPASVTTGAWMDTDVGIQSNYPEKLYVVLNDKAVAYTDDPNSTMKTSWTEWRVPLQEFANQGVDLTSVQTITIGVGNKPQDTTSPGGSGLIYIDDVRLYRP
jgi:hypothetical protein